MRPSLSVLIVTWNSRTDLARTLPALLPELSEGDELIVVDNDSVDGTEAAVRELAPAATIVQTGANRGFAAACNAGGERAGGDLLVVLNPDAAPLPGFGEAIRRPWVEQRGWAAWQALIAAAGGDRINSAGNPIHFTGIVWAGHHGEPLESAPPAGEVPVLSGACLAVPLATWRRLGGFPPEFFLYHEDVDLSLRLRLEGSAIGIEPAAVVAHDYQFGASSSKWRWLERNRLAFLVRTYPAALLVPLAPALLATELALLAAAARGGWLGQKLRANLEALRWLPRLRRERRAVQSRRTVSAAELAAWMTADLDSPLIPAVARSAPIRLLLRSYLGAVRIVLRRASR
ncbi:MAG: glycosyltransferase family 2 protein [Solirubrobacterales bacterium]